MSSSEDKEKSKTRQYAFYSGLAFQMFISLGIAAWIGQWLDDKYEMAYDLFTIALVVLVFTGFMYKLIKELS